MLVNWQSDEFIKKNPKLGIDGIVSSQVVKAETGGHKHAYNLYNKYYPELQNLI